MLTARALVGATPLDNPAVLAAGDDGAVLHDANGEDATLVGPRHCVRDLVTACSSHTGQATHVVHVCVCVRSPT